MFISLNSIYFYTILFVLVVMIISFKLRIIYKNNDIRIFQKYSLKVNILILILYTQLLYILIAIFEIKYEYRLMMLKSNNSLNSIEVLPLFLQDRVLNGHEGSYQLLLYYLTLGFVFFIYFMIMDLNKNSSDHIIKSFLKLWKYLFKIIKAFFQTVTALLLIGLSGYPIYLGTKYMLKELELEKYTMYLNLKIIFIIILGYLLLKFIWFFLIDYIKLKKVFSKKISSRKEIQNYYTQFKYDFTKIKFLDYINANYSTIKGEWSDENILKVSSNRADIYLAQLEEKWRSIEK